MKIICKTTLVIPIFLILFLYSTTSINAQEVEDGREFEYDAKSKKGPKYWGEIKEEWGACKEGRRDHMQSPIDITKQSATEVNHGPKAGELIINYKPSEAAIKNRGHDISLQWLGDAGSVRINSTDYRLKQCHWHSPSEHTINGQKYDLELHMVHMSSDQKIVVLGLLYKIGKPDFFLSKMNKTISAVADTKNAKNIGKVDPTDIHVEGSKYYRYIGSLTVPPCTEGVIWSINEELATVSKEQVELLRDAVHDYAATNARPIQSLNRHNLQFHNRRHLNDMHAH